MSKRDEQARALFAISRELEEQAKQLEAKSEKLRALAEAVMRGKIPELSEV